jgi:uncharacterized membrane protein
MSTMPSQADGSQSPGAATVTPTRDAGGAPERRLARFLGWVSLGLGIPQVLMPGAMCRLIGVRDDARSRFWMRMVGVRELAAATGILSSRRPVGWLAARALGDVKDLTLLGIAHTEAEDRRRLAMATGAVAGILATDALDAVALSRSSRETSDDGTMRVRSAITVRQPPADVYAYWHDFENLPRFMDHLESVEARDGQSHWKAKAPAGMKVEWDAEIVEDRPNELIAWRSVDGSVDNFGVVRFVPAPGDRGTEIHLDMKYAAPGGALGATAAKLFGEEPEQQVKDDLRRFKQVVEAGEVVRSDGSPEGITARRHLKQRPAHPVRSKSADGSGS